jgi:excinuclease UvrABC nuclease subunit
MPYDNTISKRGVYVVKDNDQNILYIGSSKLSMWALEKNHRYWYKKGYVRTYFRNALTKEGKEWKFEWLVEPFQCDAETIEHLEGCLITQFMPKFNLDKDPVSSSKKYGRYQ